MNETLVTHIQGTSVNQSTPKASDINSNLFSGVSLNMQEILHQMEIRLSTKMNENTLQMMSLITTRLDRVERRVNKIIHNQYREMGQKNEMPVSDASEGEQGVRLKNVSQLFAPSNKLTLAIMQDYQI